MGYVPPDVPPSVSTQLQALYRAYSAPPYFGMAYDYDDGKRPPSTPYARYVWDLYGPAKYDWFPIQNALLLVLSIALVLTIIAAIIK